MLETQEAQKVYNVFSQPGLFDQIPAILDIRYGHPASIESNFRLFHNHNTGIYDLIKKIAFDLKRRGFRKCSMDAIFHKIRWEYSIQTSGDKYKLNNNYASHYSRLLMSQEPELRGFFETRS